MTIRDQIERLLVELGRERDDAEALATRSAETLVREASGLTPLAEQDPDQVRAAALTHAAHLQRYQQLADITARLRGLLS